MFEIDILGGLSRCASLDHYALKMLSLLLSFHLLFWLCISFISFLGDSRRVRTLYGVNLHTIKFNYISYWYRLRALEILGCRLRCDTLGQSNLFAFLAAGHLDMSPSPLLQAILVPNREPITHIDLDLDLHWMFELVWGQDAKSSRGLTS